MIKKDETPAASKEKSDVIEPLQSKSRSVKDPVFDKGAIIVPPRPDKPSKVSQGKNNQTTNDDQGGANKESINNGRS
jgi:hypothetical protein